MRGQLVELFGWISDLASDVVGYGMVGDVSYFRSLRRGVFCAR